MKPLLILGLAIAASVCEARDPTNEALLLYDHHWHDDDRLPYAKPQADALHERYEHQWHDEDGVSVKHALMALMVKTDARHPPSDDR